MKLRRILLTGATGSMGLATLKALLTLDDVEVIILIRDSAKNRAIVASFEGQKHLMPVYGDLTSYEDILGCMTGVDVVLHCGALVSPVADDHPMRAMEVNYGSTVHIIKAIKAQENWQEIRLVYIGTIAETGDRMPPIHWGRVGDPIKPSVHDYYAVSKIAAERAVIESELPYWVSLRQTGILSEKMAKIEDPIMFHNCLDNVLEYVSDEDSARLMKNCCSEQVPSEFWGHIYNIGGGESCRVSCYSMFEELFGSLGFTDLSHVIDANWFATRNFHGQYYLDSDQLNDFMDFRQDSMDYFYDIYKRELGATVPIAKVINRLPGGQRMMGKSIKKRFEQHLMNDRGTMNWITQKKDDFIAPYFISYEHWHKIKPLSEMKHFEQWDEVVHIDHGYDESKPEEKLNLSDIKAAAIFRGGECLSDVMVEGDWQTKLHWRCTFGHEFEASPRLILEGGHWCPECERRSWNYHEVAKVSPFFAQVWYPLHEKDEPVREYVKSVSELDVKIDD